MSAELIGLITAVIGLIAALITLFEVFRRRRGPAVHITAPTDQESRAYIERTIWERKTPRRPSLYNSSRPPVLSIANMKGGVGKTTIAANLGAYFSAAPTDKKVLLIDFDYQGSLSQTVLGQAQITEVTMSSHHLLVGKKSAEDTLNFAPPMRFRDKDRGHIRLFRATYPFATVENEIMVEWLTIEECEVRYNLLRYLDSAEFKSAFDVAIIDCPPRITTSTINALTASTRLLIPSQPDGLSLPGVEYFSRQLMRMHDETFPKLSLLGVLPSITLASTELKDVESAELKELEEKLLDIWPARSRVTADLVMRTAFVPRTQPIRDAAGKGIAYFRNANARRVFDRLGAEVERRL